MKQILIAVALTLTLLLIPSPVAAAVGVVIDKTEGDGSWAGDVWSVNIYPGEQKSTTITLYNQSSYSSDVEATVIPDSFDDGNLTFQLDESSFTMPGNTKAELTLTVEANGSTTPGLYTAQLEIKSSEVAPPAGGGGGLPSNILAKTDYCGATSNFWISSSGRVINTFTAGCVDGPLAITVNKSTLALDEYGHPLKLLTIHEDQDPPDPPEGSNIITIPYTIGPSGATFKPALIFTWTYDTLPEGAVEDSLVIAFYNGTEWVEFECVVDTEAKTITAEVDHFTTFAALVSMYEPEEVIEGVPEEVEIVEPVEPPGPPEQVVEEEEAVEEEVEVQDLIPAAQFPWWIVVVVVAGLALLLGFLVWRQKRTH